MKPSSHFALSCGLRLSLNLAAFVSILGTSGAASAFKGPYCQNTVPQGLDGGYGVTCTGNAPVAKSNPSGRGLTHPLIAPLFWGTYWQNPTGATRGQMLAATQALVNGAHFAALSQYGSSGSIGPARMVPAAPLSAHVIPGPPVCNSNATGCFTAEINQDIALGWLPPPVAGSDMQYLVFVPPGWGDFNNAGACDATCGAQYSGLPYNYAVVVAGDIPGLSHELAENIAGNEEIANCTYVAGPNAGQAANQVADICNCYSENNLFSASDSLGSVGAYWSQVDQACVIPEGWPSIWSWNYPKPSYWTEIVSTPVRQVYNAGTSLIFTDKNNNLQYYNWSSGTVTQLGGPGAMFAFANAGANVIGLTPDAAQIFERPVAGGAWTALGLPTVMGTAVYSSGEFPMATDVNGNASYYNNGSWVQWNHDAPPGPGVAFAGSGWDSSIIELNWTHTQVWQGVPQTIGGGLLDVEWYDIAGAQSEIFANVGSDLVAGTTLGSENVWSLSPADSGVTKTQGGPGTGFAVGGGFSNAPGLWGLNPTRGEVFQSKGPLANNPGWTQIGAATGRLVGGGSTPAGLPMMIATGCANNPGTCVVY